MSSVLSMPTERRVALPSTKLLINNRWVPSESGKTFATINPATGEEICQVAEADLGDVNKAVHAARAAFAAKSPWRRMSAAERGKLLNRLADLVEKHSDELAKLESLDNGKPYAVAKAADLPLAVACYRYYAGWADKVQGKTIADRWRLFLLYPPRTCRCRRTNHTVELSYPHAGVEAGAGARHR